MASATSAAPFAGLHVAGFIDSIAGGGGFITIPAFLLSAGISTRTSVGNTTSLQSVAVLFQPHLHFYSVVASLISELTRFQRYFMTLLVLFLVAMLVQFY